MPRPLSVPLRQEIVRRHQQGIPLTQIAADLAIPYGTVRNIWRLFRRHGRRGTGSRLSLLWSPGPPAHPGAAPASPAISSANTPAWGAGLIRLQLRKHAHDGRLPSVRSLQARLRPGRSPSAAAPPHGRRRGPPSGPPPRDLASRRRRECALGHRPAHLLADRDR